MTGLDHGRLVRPAPQREWLPPSSGTWIEIDRSCLEANIEALQQMLGDSRLCMVVKGNAYGHGYDPIVPLAEAAGVRDFAVFSAREAAGFLAASDGDSRLQVMGHAEPDNAEWMVENRLQPWINDVAEWPLLKAAADELASREEPLRVHLEVETGMNRTGLDPDNAFAIAQEIAEHDRVVLEGVCTHLAGRESPENHDRVAAQKRVYHDLLERLAATGIDVATRHIASSSAAILDEDCRLDLCRIGIAAYGLWPTRWVYESAQRKGRDLVLRNVLSWKSRVMDVKDVKAGEFVGYGRSYEAEGDTRVAVVAVGYGDGFQRDLSNRGHVLIRGHRASIVGNVNMNMVQCHVTHIAEVCRGDEVVLIGRQGDREISVSSFSDFNNVVNYETMARLSWEIPRLVVSSKDLPEPLR